MDDFIKNLKNGSYDELCDGLEKELLNGPYDEASIELYLTRAGRILKGKEQNFNLLSSKNEEYNIYAMYNLHQEYNETYRILGFLKRVKQENEGEYSDYTEIMFDNFIIRYQDFLEILNFTLKEKFKFDDEKANEQLDKNIDYKWRTRFGKSGIEVKYRRVIDINEERKRRKK